MKVDRFRRFLCEKFRVIIVVYRGGIKLTAMLYGLKDIFTVVSNLRKIGGAAEATFIRLRSGEEYSNPVFTCIDHSKGQFVSLGFITESGENFLIHVDEISMIKGSQHKLICQLDNQFAKQQLMAERLHYIKRLCEINQGFVTRTFRDELIKLVRDVSVKEVEKEEIKLPIKIEENIIQMSQRMFA
jgi:hypothetical protein